MEKIRNCPYDKFIKSDENIAIKKRSISDSVPMHMHEYIEITYVFSGKGINIIDGERREVSRGSVWIVNSGKSHIISAEGKIEYADIYLDPKFMSRELITTDNIASIFALSMFDEFNISGDKFVSYAQLHGAEMIEIEQIIESMIKEFHEKEVGYKSVMKGYMQALLSKIIRRMSGIQDCRELSDDIIKYIDENSDERISLTQLAEKSFYTPTYFSRKFKEIYGKNLNAYIQERRIEKAKKLLDEQKLSIDEVSKAIGYNDTAQFYRQFKKHTGVTPGKWKSQ